MIDLLEALVQQAVARPVAVGETGPPAQVTVSEQIVECGKKVYVRGKHDKFFTVLDHLYDNPIDAELSARNLEDKLGISRQYCNDALQYYRRQPLEATGATPSRSTDKGDLNMGYQIEATVYTRDTDADQAALMTDRLIELIGGHAQNAIATYSEITREYDCNFIAKNLSLDALEAALNSAGPHLTLKVTYTYEDDAVETLYRGPGAPLWRLEDALNTTLAAVQHLEAEVRAILDS